MIGCQLHSSIERSKQSDAVWYCSIDVANCAGAIAVIAGQMFEDSASNCVDAMDSA